MRRGEVDARRTSFFVGLNKARGAQAPLIARLQPCKAEFGLGCAEIVAKVFGEGEKFGCHHGADRVAAAILSAGVAMAIAKKAGDRIPS